MQCMVGSKSAMLWNAGLVWKTLLCNLPSIAAGLQSASQASFLGTLLCKFVPWESIYSADLWESNSCWKFSPGNLFLTSTGHLLSGCSCVEHIARCTFVPVWDSKTSAWTLPFLSLYPCGRPTSLCYFVLEMTEDASAVSFCLYWMNHYDSQWLSPVQVVCILLYWKSVTLG